MEKDVIVLTCKNCGEDFLYDYRGSGKKPDYCEKCKKEVARKYLREYRKTQKEKSKTKRFVPVESVTEIIPVVERVESDFYVDEYSQLTQKVSELLMALDTTRVELCNVAKQISDYQSGYDKSDQTFLHKLENFNMGDSTQAVKFLTEWQTSRKNRRNVKDLITLVGNTINSIPYKNYANALPILKGITYKQ